LKCSKSLTNFDNYCKFCEKRLSSALYTFNTLSSKPSLDSDCFCAICLNCSSSILIDYHCNSLFCTKCHSNFSVFEKSCPFCAKTMWTVFPIHPISFLPICDS
jgi:hypothetical protein